MSDIQIHQPGYNQMGVFQDSDALLKFRQAMQGFCARLNQLPDQNSVDKTADGKAGTILISHIQMLLDEYFFGLWSEKNFKWEQIGNEIVASMELSVIHPVWGKEITRMGAAAITIMVDKAPDGMYGAEKNMWALDMKNKKSNALDMGFPKLKIECLKNAANSFGKLFGRDLNRKKQDNYDPLQRIIGIEQLIQMYESVKDKMTEDAKLNADRIINNNEITSFTKLQKELQKIYNEHNTESK